MFSALLVLFPYPQNHSLYYYGGTIQTWIVFGWCQGSSLPLQGKKYVQMCDEHISGCREVISGKDWILNEPKKVFNGIRPLKLSSVVLCECVRGLYFLQGITASATLRWERGTTTLCEAVIFLTWRLVLINWNPDPHPLTARAKVGIWLKIITNINIPHPIGGIVSG